jgi:bacterioferritin
MKHAEALIERILFFEGIPKMTESLEINVGADVRSRIESDLKLEIDAVGMYNRFVQLALPSVRKC